MFDYNVSIEIQRGTEVHSENAIADKGLFMLPIDADVLEGDVLSRTLPNGHIQKYKATRVTVYETPFRSGRDLNHTEVEVESLTCQDGDKTGGAQILNVKASNVQLTAGNSYGSVMNNGTSSDDIAAILEGLAELSRSRPFELGSSEQEAVIALRTQLENGLQKKDSKGASNACQVLKEWAERITDKGVSVIMTVAVQTILKFFGV
ncbi:MAG: hypothetical protein LKF61_03250 [Eggerthellaceae bacterium]|jgi:hypothetical protein|nr:hypothetical protein [Eggerthellaceae bacterium]